MIWSEQELANMPLGGERFIVERFMKHLDEPANEPIFKPENFSYLWGILGVAGLKGASEEAREEIWEALKRNGAVDAYDKGILGDFNHHLFKTYGDNRLVAWRKLDNYDAGLKFRNGILHELLKTNEKLEKETAPYCLDVIKLISGLQKISLQPQLKAYLEQIRSKVPDANDDLLMAAAYEKEDVLRKLTDVLVYAKRTFSESEKEYFYFYLKEAVAGGFKAKSIGVDDRVLSRLLADGNLDEMAELDAYPLRARNADILALAQQLEANDAFFEQTAAQYILNDKRKIPELVERCLTLINVTKAPRGVFFALQLSNLKQIKSAFKILIELAKKGRATEAACFVHRLLPYAKGAEKLLADILITNLNQLRANPFLGDNKPFLEYVARIYLQAAHSFAEGCCFKESALLLKKMAEGGCLTDLRAVYPGFISLANMLLMEDKEETLADISEAAELLHLQVYEDWKHVFIGEEKDNPLTAARQKLQNKVKETTTFDVGRVLDKMSKAEASTYGVYRNVKDALNFKKKDEDAVMTDLSSLEALSNEHEEPAPVVEEVVAQPVAEVSEVTNDDDNKEFTNNSLETKVNSLDEYWKAPVQDTPAPDEPLDAPAPVPFQKMPDAPANEQPIAEFKETEVSEIGKWPDTVEEKATEEKTTEPVAHETNVPNRARINIKNILNIKAEDVDKHFDKIKQVTSTAIQRAEEQAKRLKSKVRIDEEDIEQGKKVVSDSVKKIFKIFKK